MTDSDTASLIPHLNALRQMLIRILLILSILFIPLFFTAPFVIQGLIQFINHYQSITLHYFAPLDIFILQIKMAFILDLVICFPYIVVQIWHFILPALYENERRFLRSLTLVSTGLFISGVCIGLLFVLPLLIRFGLSFETTELQAVLNITSIISLALGLSVSFGIMFQFPLIPYFLIRFGITSYKTVKNKRPYVFVFILIISALLTPPDIVSQLTLSLPTYLLFEMGLLLSRK